MTREIPSRSMSAKEVRPTREKSWSGKCSPIAHAASRSALVVCSMVATPLRNPSQKVSAASAEMKWWMRRQVSTSMWSLVTSGSSVIKSCFARPFCRSQRSAAAYQAELSTKRLMTHWNDGTSSCWSLPQSFGLFLMQCQCLWMYRGQRQWSGHSFVKMDRPSPGLQVGACTRQLKCPAWLHAHELAYTVLN